MTGSASQGVGYFRVDTGPQRDCSFSLGTGADVSLHWRAGAEVVSGWGALGSGNGLGALYHFVAMPPSLVSKQNPLSPSESKSCTSRLDVQGWYWERAI